MDKASTLTTPEVGTNSADVHFVPHVDVPGLWPTVFALLEEKGDRMLSVFSEQEVYNLLCSRVLDLWVGIRKGEIEGVAFCGWEVHERARYYHILHAMGKNARLYIPLGLPMIEKWAFGFGATEVVIEGRPGWLRLLRPYGYLTPTVRLRKNVRRAWGH